MVQTTPSLKYITCKICNVNELQYLLLRQGSHCFSVDASLHTFTFLLDFSLDTGVFSSQQSPVHLGVDLGAEGAQVKRFSSTEATNIL